MKHAIYSDNVTRHFVEDGVGKSSQHRTAILFQDNGIEYWLAEDSVQAGIDAAKKLFAESPSSLFLPAIDAVQLKEGTGFDQLRDREDFQTLLNSLQAPVPNAPHQPCNAAMKTVYYRRWHG